MMYLQIMIAAAYLIVMLILAREYKDHAKEKRRGNMIATVVGMGVVTLFAIVGFFWRQILFM